MNAQTLIYIKGAPPSLFTPETRGVCVVCAVLKWEISNLALKLLFHKEKTKK